MRNYRASYLYDTDIASTTMAIARRERSIDSANVRSFAGIWRDLSAGIADTMRLKSIWYGGAALAASIAVVAFIAIPSNEFHAIMYHDAAQHAASSEYSTSSEYSNRTAADSVQWFSDNGLSTVQQNLLSAMMLSHNEFALNGRLSRVRLVSYESISD